MRLLDHCGSLMLGVCEEAQGRGIGSTLLAILLTTARLHAAMGQLRLVAAPSGTAAFCAYRTA